MAMTSPKVSKRFKTLIVLANGWAKSRDPFGVILEVILTIEVGVVLARHLEAEAVLIRLTISLTGDDGLPNLVIM